ncbi:MAG: RNA polymerase sigma factor (sigma-70 family) [Bacteroidia bacterium]|jgi:RNA polymerase sigma factor (sigma-70 family)
MPRPIIDTLQSHHSDSWGWALACCDWDQTLAEDTLQEAYLRVLDGRAHFRGDSSEKTWFFSVVRRVSAEQRRAHSKLGRIATRMFAANSTVGAEPSPNTPMNNLDKDESRQQLLQALQKLSPRQREVLHLVFYCGLTLEEAASTLALSLGSARTHYHRGKTQLALQLEIENE